MSEIITVDDSILKAYDACPMKGFWMHEKHIAHGAEGIALVFGRVVHEGLGLLYGKAGVPAACEVFKDHYTITDPKGLRTVAKGEEIITAWEEQLMGDGYEGISGETMIKYPLTSYLMFVGNIDHFGKRDGEYLIQEWKTSGYPNQFITKPNQQITGYCFLASLHFRKRIDKVLVTIAGLFKTSKGGYRSTRDGGQQSIFRQDPPVTIEDWEFEAWQRDVRTKCEDILRYRESGHYPQKTESCTDFGGCQFLPLCSVAPKYRDMIIESSYVPYHWNPETKGG